jgi:hypothetical protein
MALNVRKKGKKEKKKKAKLVIQRDISLAENTPGTRK